MWNAEGGMGGPHVQGVGLPGEYEADLQRCPAGSGCLFPHTITNEREVMVLFEILEKRCEINLSAINCSHREMASWSVMILNDVVSANAIMKRATRHYRVMIKTKSAAETPATETA